MTEDFALQSLRYLLNEMGPTEREHFDRRLQENPGDCALFKSYADALAAHVEKQAGDSPVLTLEQALRLLEGLHLESPAAAPRQPPAAWKRYFWPAAAAVLLAFNLWQLGLRIHNDTTPGPEEAGSSRLAQAGTEAQSGEAKAMGTAVGKAPGASGANRGASHEAELAALLQRHEQLQAECEALQGIKDGLSAESQRILMRLRTLSVSDRSGNSLAAMELVTPLKYASGERKGLLEAARKILSTPGGVTNQGNNGAASAGTSNTGLNENGQTVGPTPGTSYIPPTTAVPTPSPGTNQNIQSQPGTEDSLIVLGAVMQGTSVTAGATAAEPYAWTVMDGTSSEGCINFYNLPPVSSGEALVLWTKSAEEGSGFVRVDSLPSALAGKSGNIFFRSADGSLPAEILVTKEGTAQVPVVPSNKVVLRGP